LCPGHSWPRASSQWTLPQRQHNHVRRIEQAVAAYQRTALEEQTAVRQEILKLGRQLEAIHALRLTKEDRRRIGEEGVER
jgi:hypothetical protein